jgi:DNA-directed RNA polymerase subunit A'
MDSLQLVSIQLQLYTDDEVRKLAVVQVTNPSTYDRGLPKANGVNDARMGVTDKALQCPTCGLTSTCNNHYGYIELEKPVVRLGHMASVLSLLRCVCWACSKPKFTVEGYPGLVDVRTIVSKTSAGTKDRLRGISEACKNRYRCVWCDAPQPVYSRVNKLFFDRSFRPKELEFFVDDEERAYVTNRLMPDEIRSILHHIPFEALRILGYKPEISHPENYVMKAHIVPPPSIRPASSVASTEARLRGENDLTVCLQDIVRVNNELAEADEDKVLQLWDKLQIFCAALINQNVKKLLTFNGTSVVHARAIGKRQIKDIKKRLTGKKGRLRGNLSGKRVDHAGRSVVGPDASHDIFELGVPASIMRTLTFPENVNDRNVDDLAQRIIRGAASKDGALTVTMPDIIGQKILHVSLLDLEGRRQLAANLKSGYTVERHLRDGDWVLFNRQPSLHKASIMAFRAYEVKGAQFKLPLPCTKPFNADFDGDEMNLHALQDYTAIAEAQEIMSVPNQMVTPQSNSVIIALVQDSLVGAFLMSRRDALVNREEAMQLAMCIHYSTKSNYEDLPGRTVRSFVDDW